jgi:hypothetical protein
VACLYCGKEIGPFRLLRDDEFCCNIHRKRYGDRLGRALDWMGEPDAAPAGIAGFQATLPPLEGSRREAIVVLEFGETRPEIQISDTCPVAIGPVLGAALKQPEWTLTPVPALNDCHRASASYSRARRTIVLPALAVRPVEGLPAPEELVSYASQLAGPAAMAYRAADSPGQPIARAQFVFGAAPAMPPQAPILGGARGIRTAGPVLDPNTQPEEALLPPATERSETPYPAPAVRLPSLESTEAESQRFHAFGARAVRAAGPVHASQPQPVEAILPLTTEPSAIPYPQPAAVLPAVAKLEDVASIKTSAPAAELAMRLVDAAVPFTAQPFAAAFDTPAMSLPAFGLAAAQAECFAADHISVAAAGVAPAAEMRPVQAAASSALAAAALCPVPAALLPTLAITTSGLEFEGEVEIEATASAGPAAAPLAQPLEALLPAAMEPQAVPYAAAALCAPVFQVAAAEREPAEIYAELSAPPPLVCERWMAVASSEAVELAARPAVAEALYAAASPQSPGFAVAATGAGMPVSPARPARVLTAAASPARPLHADEPLVSAALQLPMFGGLQLAMDAAKLVAPALRSVAPAPSALQFSAAISSLAIVATRRQPLLSFQQFTLSEGKLDAAGLDVSGPQEAQTQPQDFANAQPAAVQSIPTIAVKTPEAPTEQPTTALPQPGLLALEFHCSRVPMRPASRPKWQTPEIALSPPRFAVRPAFDSLRKAEPAPKKEARKATPSFAEIFTMPGVPKPKRSSTPMAAFARAIAASLLVGVALWFGVSAVKIGRQMGAETAANDVASGAASRSGGAQNPGIGAGSSPGFFTRVRHAVATRAAVEYADSFHGNMEAWGATAKSWLPGWARNPDGYVHTGQLAIYHPTVAFTNYKMEFFGQIESKSMGWVIRAHDPKNYYAMKLTVAEPGPRPTYALVHYPVVDGKRGERVSVPLAAMLHSNMAYQVGVEVRGNRVITSIEGEQVESYIDETLKAGGIGFFSDAGERARLYWMKVAKNQDFLGRVCSFVANITGEKTQTAELWAPEIPAAPGREPEKAPHTADVALAAAQPGMRSFKGPQRARLSKDRRFEPWAS